MTKHDKQQSELIAAAEALDAELRKFESLAEAAKRESLNSQKNLERVAHTLKEVTESDDRLAAHVRTLVGVIANVRDRQQEQAQAVVARAQELQQRTELFQGLLTRFGELGQVAGQLNTLVQQVAVQKQAATTPEQIDSLVANIREIQEQMGRVAEAAQSLATLAAESQFVDIERQAESLRQQLLSAKNKMNLLQKSLSRG